MRDLSLVKHFNEWNILGRSLTVLIDIEVL